MGTIQHLEACGVDLYLDQQALDTTTPAGKLMFQITGAFAEFERSMIRTRVNAGKKLAKDQIKRQGQFVTKHGEVKKRLGRPGADPEKLRKARAELAKGIGIVKIAKAATTAREDGRHDLNPNLVNSFMTNLPEVTVSHWHGGMNV